MKTKKCYELMGEDYSLALKRLINDDFIEKYIHIFARNDCYERLCKAMEEKNVQEAFKAVHGLKGISSNMSFMKLYKVSDLLTEELRKGEYTETACVLFEQLQSIYAVVIDAIKLYMSES